MRNLKHPWDWVGHFIWFFVMALYMYPTWAVAVCAIALEIDQILTWGIKGRIKDTVIDLIADGFGIYLAWFIGGY